MRHHPSRAYPLRSHHPHQHCTPLHCTAKVTTAPCKSVTRRSRPKEEEGRKKKRSLMTVVSGGNGGGRLNPWAEPFVPSGVRYCGLQTTAEAEVEDFSPEWWRLVAASPAFRDRWLRDYEAAADDHDDDAEVNCFLPEDILSPPPPARQGGADGARDEAPAGRTRAAGLEVAAWGFDKWRRAHGSGSPPEVPRYADKAPRKVAGGARVSPRSIQQPR